MDRKAEKIFIVVIYFSLLSISALVIFNSSENRTMLVTLALLMITLFSARWLTNNKPSVYRKLGMATLLFDIGTVYWISFLDISSISQLYFYVIVSTNIIFYYGNFSLIFTFITYVSLIASINIKYLKWNYFDFNYLFPIFVENSLYFVIVAGIAYVIKFQVNQKIMLTNAMKQLELQAEYLENTNKKLQDTMEALEDMTALKERNRIAREIHDTVGHTLTTVLIEIEAGKRLINKNYSMALEKLELAQGQVRKGLNDIRQSVRMLKEGDDILDLLPSIRSLVEETEKHAGVSVECIISSLPPLSQEQGRVLYRALQEGLTNGIRHGRSTVFVFKLQFSNNKITFSLEDNGSGCEHITLGFGLTSMRDKVQELGGSFDIVSLSGRGCCLTVEFPVEKESIHESYQDTCSR